MKKSICANCNKSFIDKNKTNIRKYCSLKCFREVRNKKKRLKRLSKVKIINIKCNNCKKSFSKKSNSLKLLCSEKCKKALARKRDWERKKKLLKTDKNFREHYYKVRKKWAKKNQEKVKKYRLRAESKPEYKKKRKKYLQKYNSKKENKIRRKKWEKEWRKRDYVKKRKKEYKLKNKKHIQKWNKNYVQRPVVKERIRKIRMHRYKTDPIYLIKNRIRTRMHVYVKRGLAEKKVQTNVLIGCSWKHLKNHLEKKFEPGMKWSNYGKWHIDHFKPMSHFNLFDIQEQLKCCNYKNLQPKWAEDNLSKGDRFIG